MTDIDPATLAPLLDEYRRAAREQDRAIAAVDAGRAALNVAEDERRAANAAYDAARIALDRALRALP